MITVNTHQAKTQLSKLLAAIEEKQITVRICRNGKPIADLKPAVKNSNPLQRHKQLSDIKIITNHKWSS